MMIAPRTSRTVSAEQMDRLLSWNARKPVIAIMGEFSAGKSTLLNMLIGQAILPTQVTATKLPPVWLRHGTDAPYRVDKNNARHPVDLNDLSSVPIKDTRYIRIYCESEVLESCDLLDTPGISDPNIPMSMWMKTIGYASAALWCTHAGQAWRESERGVWESLPERLRRHSLLLVTRSDKITSEIDRMKIDNRLRRETDNLFGGRLFVSLINALRALEGDGDSDLWSASGAEAFVEQLAGSIAAINDERSIAIRRYKLDTSNMPRVLPRRVRPGSAEASEGSGAANSDAPSSGASVVPIRSMRVVASNEDPIEAAAPLLRPTLHEVTAEVPPHSPLVLDERIETEEASVWDDAEYDDAEDVEEHYDDLHEEVPATDLFTEDMAAFEAAEDEDETALDEAAETVAEDVTIAEELAIAEDFAATEAYEPIADLSAAGNEAALDDTAAAEPEAAEEDHGTIEAMMYGEDAGQAHQPLSEAMAAEDDLTFAEGLSADGYLAFLEEAQPEDMPPAGNDASAEIEHAAEAAPEALLTDGEPGGQTVPDLPADAADPQAAEPAFAEAEMNAPQIEEREPEAAAEDYDGAAVLEAMDHVLPETHDLETAASDDQAQPAVEVTDDVHYAAIEAEEAAHGPELTSAEDTIEAVLASISLPEPAEADNMDAEPAPVTATALWRAVLADRSVVSVQDMLEAMTDFAARIDAAGLQLPAAAGKDAGQDMMAVAASRHIG